MVMFKPVPTQVDFVTQEHEVLRFWEEQRIFARLQARNAGGPRWRFVDGPITANNPMGVHHALGRTYKDVWHRFAAMRGLDTRYQNGFDCQGLWVEVNVEKDLGFKSKRDIERYGIAEFVRLCKQRVLKYAGVITEQCVRLGYWMDWDDPARLRLLHDKLGTDPDELLTLEGRHGPVSGTAEQLAGQLGMPQLGGSYFTFSDENNYQIWTFLKRCHERGLIYRGHDVMPWCPRCATGLSQHEIVTEGYTERTDPGLTVKFPLREQPGKALLVWTTTPWTLAANVAAAVGPDLEYVEVEQGGERFYLARGTQAQVLRGAHTEVRSLRGREMEGWTYDGPFDELPAAQRAGAPAAHRVILWTDVGEAEGTGIVHIAPGCGAEDFALGKTLGLPVVAPIDEEGVYVEGFDWLTGRFAGDVADDVAANLKQKGRYYRLEAYVHRYPQCWRCGTPLLFRLVDEWFISMEPLREPMMAVTRQIRWIPDFGLERELDWLRNMHDWMISKKRYWGLALPIWVCAQCGEFDVIGDEHELQARAVEGWESFAGHTPHRPYIDAIKLDCPHCGSEAGMSRIPDVGNPWLDAGIVPYSTQHYRLDREFWQSWFPADFITESFPGQFRNWFYSLLAMSTVLENQPPFLNVLGYATVLDEHGAAMHKSAGNMIEFSEAAEKAGVDVLRWLFCAHRPEADLWFGYGPADEVRRRFLIPLWNVYAFLANYAIADGWQPAHTGGTAPIPPGAALTELDRWIVARLHQIVATVTVALEYYDAYAATCELEAFLDDLSNWYVRRNRRRFWRAAPPPLAGGAGGGGDSDKDAAYSTLYHVMVTLVKLIAPFAPFVADVIYRNLVCAVDPTAPESVHLALWPSPAAEYAADDLVAAMAGVRQVVALGHAARSQANQKVRQPLAKALVSALAPATRAAVETHVALIADELNVKTVELVDEEGDVISYSLLPDNRKLGPKFGALFPAVRQALAAVDAAAVARAVRAGQSVPLALRSGETIILAADEIIVQSRPRAGFNVASDGDVTVALDTALTPELLREGLARDLVRAINDLRKRAGLDVTDRIVLAVRAEGAAAEAVAAWRAYIAGETLARAWADAPGEGFAVDTLELDGGSVTVGVKKVSG
jgi:isoleucyl-tRNA synthetase